MNPIAAIRSEWAHARGALAVRRRLAPFARDAGLTLRDEIEEWAAAWKDRPALIGERETLTYRALFAHANRWARWAILHGVETGDRVALLMLHRPEYIAAWIGIAMAGGVAALVDADLSGAVLARSVALADPHHIVVDADLLPRFETAAPHLPRPAAVWVHGPHDMAYLRLDEALDDLSDARLGARDRRPLTRADDCIWICTATATGRPEATRLDHGRVLDVMNAVSAAAGATAQDRLYLARPTHRSVDAVVAPGIALTIGGACILRETDSVSTFWSDVRRHDCTILHQTDDLCRRLLAAPSVPDETRHRLRLAEGRGLGPDIGPAFRTRFHLSRALAWLVVGDGDAVLFDFDGRSGAVGRIPRYLRNRLPIRVVRFDRDRGEVVRTAAGRAILAAADEIGEAIAPLPAAPLDTKTPPRRPVGDADPGNTGRRILLDIFEPGDAWIGTATLLRRNRRGYVDFVGRVGDLWQHVSHGEIRS